MKTAWIVDDEQDIAEAVAMILESAGFEIKTFANGKAVVDYFTTDGTPAPNIIFLDVMMPYLNGYDVLKVIRNAEKGRDVPVVLMSAVHPSTAQKNPGWNDFLKKPFTLEALESVVEKLAS